MNNLKTWIIKSRFKFLALLLAVLVFATPLEASQPNNDYLPKDEIVYGRLDSEGHNLSTFVVNRFMAAKPTKICDFGTYSKVSNLTKDINLNYHNSRLNAAIPMGVFYYQGLLTENRLPWQFDIKYSLNGKRIKPELIAGQSGALKIDLKVRLNKDQSLEHFQKNFMLQIIFSLNGQNVDQVKAKHGTTFFVGGKYNITYMVLPNKEVEYQLLARGEDWHLDPVTISAIPYAIDLGFDLPDADAIAHQFAPLQEGLAQLADGMSQLHNGLLQGKQGMHKLSDGLTELHCNGYKIANGIYALNSGLNELSDGMLQYGDGLSKASNGAQQLSAGLKQLNDNVEMLLKDEYIDELQQFIDKILPLLDILITAEDKLNPVTLVAIHDDLDKVSAPLVSNAKNIGRLQANIEQLAALSKAYLGSLETLGADSNNNNNNNDNLSHKQIKVPIRDFAAEKEITELKTTIKNLEALQVKLNNLPSQTTVIQTVADRTYDSSQTSGRVTANNGAHLPSADSTAFTDHIQPESAVSEVDITGAETTDSTDATETVEPSTQFANKVPKTENNSAANLSVITQEVSKTPDPQALTAINDELATVIADMNKQISNLENKISSYNAENRKSLNAVAEQIAVRESELAAFSIKAKDLSTDLTNLSVTELLNKVEQLKKIVETLKGNFSSVEDLQKFITKLKDLKEFLQKNRESIKDIAKKLHEFKDGVKQLADGGSELAHGLKLLDSNFGLLRYGVSRAASGTAELYCGFNMYLDGIGQAGAGAYKLADGLDQLSDGANSLAKGSALVVNKTQNIGPMIADKMQEFTQDVLPQEYVAESFVDQRNRNVRSVQFVFMTTAEPQLPSTESTTAQTSKQTASENSFFDKIKALF